MAETKWTPGEWFRLGHSVHPDRPGLTSLVPIAECKVRRVGAIKISLSEATANAHLIASAPGLYAALEQYEAAFFALLCVKTGDHKAYGDAVSALKRASDAAAESMKRARGEV